MDAEDYSPTSLKVSEGHLRKWYEERDSLFLSPDILLPIQEDRYICLLEDDEATDLDCRVSHRSGIEDPVPAQSLSNDTSNIGPMAGRTTL
jgi:hypothetical protein